MKDQIKAACVVCLSVAVLLTAAMNLMCDMAAASTWNIEVVDPMGEPGDYSSIALDGNDYPHMGYTSIVGMDYNLMHAWWDGSMWNLAPVDSSADVGAWVSLVLNATGYPQMTSLDGTNGDL